MQSLLKYVPGKGPEDAAVPPNNTFITTTDGVKIAWERHGRLGGPVVVLVHGWSGSRHYFDLNARPLANAGCTGLRIARLAADLRDLLTELDLQDVTVVGTSMGAAVIWCYIELFGEARLKQAVFVDQAPLQNTAPDWKWGSTGCYDLASLTRLQCKVEMDFPGFARDNGRFCTSLPLAAEVVRVLEQETLRADPAALGQLMADHTTIDWRPLLPRIQIPCLNIVGRQSAVFPWYGSEAVGKLVPNAHTVFFEKANHWLYLEQPEAFNKLVADFVQNGFLHVSRVLHL
ncbi:hypothetical protein CHLNCDRAFT_140070 [Chlorella variabilis]|uniref:AB hydrolase-1 domain-containing protein n=1 Tax=Chlorella variabilis TaxID=554065 RepID=E1ZRI6_CHLVA|nr:hypothetical protein CHLNCDRAFT_140070 [Chlorella variabilis]EFN51577.1 hypothetical protein CHLNCDRAFT_140070 [Chlorella variabilis]|eukprot:XP_005843679.1 hypothetical protein CHLNCDRAFT_140070 [Chlorella variabilis]